MKTKVLRNKDQQLEKALYHVVSVMKSQGTEICSEKLSRKQKEAFELIASIGMIKKTNKLRK